MKKVFKKSIACLIAALMIFSTLPLTPPISAEAAEVSSIKDLTFDKATATAKGYHYTTEATGGYNNILYCSQNTTCEKDFVNVGSYGYFKTFAPSVVVMMYDGTTAGFPITFESYSGENWLGNVQTYNLRSIIWNGNSNFEFRHPWYGYADETWDSWPNYNATNSIQNVPVTSSNTNIEMKHSTHRIFNNEVYYKGTGNSTDYYESISGTKVQIDVNKNKKTKSTNSSIYVLDYKNFYAKVETVKSIQKNLVDYPNRYTTTSSEKAINAVKAYYNANERVKTAFNSVNDSNAASTVESVATDMKNAVAAINDVNLECTHNTTRVVGAVPATCVSKGQSGTVYCAYCDNVKIADSYETAINPKNHKSEVDLPAKDSTCSSTGLTAGKQCTACGVITVAQQTVDMKPHTEVIDEAVAPTCTATGLTAGKHCSVCNEVIQAQQTVDALGHDLKVVAGSAKAPTCTQAGKNADKKCSRCDYIEVGATIDATGHSYTVKVTAPTCTAQGYTTYTCGKCGDSYVADYKDATGHSEVEIPAVEATCTTEGSTAGTKCSVCDVIIVEPQTIPATGHSYKYTYNSNNNGTHTKACQNCDDIETEPCTNELMKEGTTSDTWHCTLCLNKYEREVVDMSALNEAIVQLEAVVSADEAEYKYKANALANAKSVLEAAKAYAENPENRYAEQPAVNRQATEVNETITTLTTTGLAEYTVTFELYNYDDGSQIGDSFSVTRKYGEVAEKSYTFDKTEEGFPEYVVGKWTKKVLNDKGEQVDTVLNSTANDMSVVVKENATYTCCVLKFKASTEGENATTRVRYLDKSGKTLKIDYVRVGKTYTPNSEVPKIPYYRFTEWKRVYGEDTPVGTRELVYQAQYDYDEVEANNCIIVGLKGVMVNGSANYSATYDEKIELTGADKYAYADEYGNIIAPINENYIFAPHLNGVDKTIYITKVETPITEAKSIVTGVFTIHPDDSTYNYLVINAQYYLPEGAKAVEAGAVIGNKNDANVLKIGSALKVVSDTQGDNHEYSLQMSYSKNKTGTLYARSYLIYVDSNGDTQTVYSDDITTCNLTKGGADNE